LVDSVRHYILVFGHNLYCLLTFKFLHDEQKNVRLDRHHKTSGISSVTRTESTQQGQGLIEQQMQDFGKLQEETSALGILTRKLE